MTGNVDNWVNVDTFGPIYPFVGTEFLLVLIALAFWIGWHIWQMRSEATEFKKDIEKINQRGGVDKVLDNESDREVNDLTGG